MTDIFLRIRSWLSGLSSRNRVNSYFLCAWQLEYENKALLARLMPLIRYPFLAAAVQDLADRQTTDCRQADLELASAQLNKPPVTEPGGPEYGETDYHQRTWLINRLLENCKTLSSLYLHLSYSDTIAQPVHFQRLKSSKDLQIDRIQDLVLRLN